MAVPREHPIDHLIITVADTAKLMWEIYDAHITKPRYDEAWQARASEIFSRCNACEERLLKLKHLRTTNFGVRFNGSANGTA